jgi:translocation and assembly module TamB
MNWKKIIRWAVLLVLGLTVILFVAAYTFVHTTAFDRWVLAKVIEQVQDSTGGRVEIQSIVVDWKSLDVDLYGLGLYGAGSGPLFRADHLRVGVKIVSLLRRKFDLAEVILDRPVVYLLVDAQGNTNMPRPARGGKSSNSANTIFDMAIGHVSVNSGQIYYNDKELPLTAELNNVHAEIAYRLLSSEYKGSVGYEHGRFNVEDFNSIEHDALLQFTATRAGIAVEQLLATTGKSHITVRARLSDYANPSIEGNYEAVLFTEEMANILKNRSIPIGQATMTGTLRFQNAPGGSFLDDAYVDGRLGSLQLVMREGPVSTPIKSVQCKYSLEHGNLHVQDFQAEILRGRMTANMEMFHLTGNSKSRLEAALKGVSLADVSGALPPGKYKRVLLVGTANADVQATWANKFQELIAHTHAVISSGAQRNAQGSAIPVDGDIDVKYDGEHDSASFGHSTLRTRSTQISLAGIISKQSNLNLQANTSDLFEVAVLADKIQSAVGGSTEADSQPYDLHGSAQFNGQVHGSVTAPTLQGQLVASDIQVDGSRWRTLRTAIDLSPSRVALQNGFLASTKQGQINFSASAGLKDWTVTPTSSISLHATAANLSAADFERLANEKYPVTGTLSANVAIDGSREAPTGEGSIQLARASAWDEPIRNLTVDFKGTKNEIHSTAQLQAPAGTVSADLTFSLSTEEYVASVNASGLKIEQINALKTRDLGISGTLTASGSGRGTLKDPQFTANIQLPQLQVRDQTISQVQGQLTVARQHANFAIQSVVSQGTMEAKGDLGLAGEYPAEGSVDIRSLPIGPLLASYIPGSRTGLEGQTEIHATLSGPLKEPTQLAVHLEIPVLNLQYRTAQIALVRPLKVDYRDGVASLQPTELKGNGTDLTLQGVMPIKSLTQSSVTANGTVDLSLLQGFTSGVQSSGRIDINLSAAGGLSSRSVRGQLRIVNAALTTDTIPIGFEGVNGQLQISGNRLDISQFTGKAGGGEINMGGFLIYGSQSNFNVNLDARNVRMRYPEGLRSVLSGNVRLTGTALDSTLSGRVTLDKLSFTQQFDLSNFVGQFGSELPSAPGSFQQNMKLNVSLQSADQLNLASSKVSMAGAASLTLTGTLANPVVLGRVTLTGGDVFFLGKRYVVQSGTIEFSNPVMTEPVLNLYVTTTVEQYNITLNFTGPVDRMRTNYTSIPSLPPADIINLIARGQTAEESATSSTPTSLGAESVLAQGASSQVSGKLEKLTGISQLMLDPMAGNNQQDPGAQVAIQQRVTGNLLVTFSTNVTSTQSTTVQVQYQTSRQTSISLVRDQNGGYALDVGLHKTF